MDDSSGSNQCAERLEMNVLPFLTPQAVLVDMEEGVVNEILQGPLGEVFDSTQLLTDVSGSGNNW